MPWPMGIGWRWSPGLACVLLLSWAAWVRADAFVYARPYLRDARGAETSLKQLADGDLLVAVVLKGTWCRVCTRQLAELARLERRLEALDTRVVGIAVESPARAEAARRQQRLPFPILADPEHAAVSSLRLWRADWGHPLPAIVVFDRCGDERGRFEGRRPGLRPEPALLRLLESLAAEPDAGCLPVLAAREAPQPARP